MSNNDKQQWLNTLLSAEHADQFAQIQRHLGINNRSDVVRYLINQEARRINSQADPQHVGAGLTPAR